MLLHNKNKFVLCVRCGETLVIIGEKSWEIGMAMFLEKIDII